MSIYIVYFLMVLTSISCSSDENHSDQEYWQTATPESQGVNNDSLGHLLSSLDTMDQVFSFLLIKNGFLISEKYYNGKSQESLFHLRSITKSIIGTMVGVALDDGHISSIDDPIVDYISDLKGIDRWDEVTVYHLLNMLSGMDWNENDDVIPWLENTWKPIDFFTDRGIVHDPGSVFNYSTAAVHLLSHVVKEATGKSIESYTRNKLLDPLGIKQWDWERDRNGDPRGGTGISLRSRDIAKIGQLYLQNGTWDDNEIIAATWVEDSWLHPIDLGQFNPNYVLDFRNLWWSYELEGYTINYAEGYGGQILAIIPQEDMIVVINREHFVASEDARLRRLKFFRSLLPSIISTL